ncbi:MAG: hypothetical protein ACRC6K_02880 [Fusobacteriaceae bacterium]
MREKEILKDKKILNIREVKNKTFIQDNKIIYKSPFNFEQTIIFLEKIK